MALTLRPAAACILTAGLLTVGSTLLAIDLGSPPPLPAPKMPLPKSGGAKAETANSPTAPPAKPKPQQPLSPSAELQEKPTDLPEGEEFDAPVPKAGDAAPPLPASAAPPVKLSPELYRLRDLIRRTLGIYHQRPVNARDHTPWEVFHWLIAYNVDADLYTRGPGGPKANVASWLCANQPCHGQQLLAVKNGRPTGLYGVGLEGHEGQFMAVLAQSRIMIDYPLTIEGRKFTVQDLVDNQKLTCKSGTELTFQLIGLSHYLDLNDEWRNLAGEPWSVPRIIQEEIGKPIHGSACGGTHRLMGLSYCVKKRLQKGHEVDGEYRRAEVYVQDYVKFALRMQNADGSFSTEWFSGPGDRDDIDRKIQTTGHILEWLVFTLPEDRLRTDPQIKKAVNFVSRSLLAEPGREWKIGPLGHSLRSLSLYDRKVFKALDAPPVPALARRPKSPAAGAIDDGKPNPALETIGDDLLGTPSAKEVSPSNEDDANSRGAAKIDRTAPSVRPTRPTLQKPKPKTAEPVVPSSPLLLLPGKSDRPSDSKDPSI